MNNSSDQILVFAGAAPEAPSPLVRRGLRDQVEKVAIQASSIAVSSLQENMRRFLSRLDTIIRASPKDLGGLTLDEVEIQAQIDGRGNVGICGIAGAEFAAQGGIKFVLRKKV